MGTYIIQGRYTAQAMKGFLAQPEDRSKAVKALLEAGGGRLIGFYITFGEFDFLVIAEGKSEHEVLATLLPVAASGTVTDLRTMVAISGEEARQAMVKAAAMTGYRAPGS